MKASVKYIPIPINSERIKRIRYELDHLGPSLYILMLNRLSKSPRFMLKLDSTTIGILSDELGLNRDKEELEEWLKQLTKLKFFSRQHHKKGFLFSKDFVKDLYESGQISKKKCSKILKSRP